MVRRRNVKLVANDFSYIIVFKISILFSLFVIITIKNR